MNRTIGVFAIGFALLIGLLWLKIDRIEKHVNYTMQSVLIVEEKIDELQPKGESDAQIFDELADDPGGISDRRVCGLGLDSAGQ